MVIVILAAIAIAIVAIVRTGRSNRVEHGAAEARGLDILAERFARGEVDAETYRSMKAELEAKS